MEDNKKNSHANEDSVEFHSGDLVILTDDDGNEVRYEYLDQIEYSDSTRTRSMTFLSPKTAKTSKCILRTVTAI